MKFSTLWYVKKDGKTLMMHRVKKEQDMHEWKWNWLWWKIEEGESPEECMIREIKEESWLDVKNPKLRSVMTFPNFAKNETWHVFLYVIDEVEWELIESNEGNLEWIDDDKVLDLNLWKAIKYL